MHNIQSLTTQYLAAKQAYYNTDSPIMMDVEFDELERQLAILAPNVVKRVGTERGGKVDLPIPMGSLNQVFDQAELIRWAKKYPMATRGIATEKIDGNSVLLQYRNGILVNSFSRGNGIRGANNLRHISLIPTIPHILSTPYTGTVRGEIAIPKALWPQCQAIATSHSGKQYANARNFTAGFLNGKTGQAQLYQYFKLIAFDAQCTDLNVRTSKLTQLEWLESIGFTVPRYQAVDIRGTMFPAYRTLCDKMVANSVFEADGIVVDVDDQALRDTSVNLDDINPTHAIKIKPVASAVTTAVKYIELNVSKDGYVKPVLVLEPVNIVGVTVTRCTGFNIAFILENELQPGTMINVQRNGDVIPYVASIESPGPLSNEEYTPWLNAQLDEVAGTGNWEWTSTGVDVVLVNKDTADVALQVMEHFFAKLEVEFVGAGNVKKLFEYGITTPAEAITAPNFAFEQAFGSNGKKAYTSMCNRLNGVTPAKLFAALGAFGRGIGERKLTALFAVIPFTRVLNGQLTTMDIAEVAGFDNKSAHKIFNSAEDAREKYHQIIDHITFAAPKAVPTTGALLNQVYCPTGVRFSPEIKAKIEALGGECTDTLSSKVTTLVTKDLDSTSSKIEKARQKGVTIISLDQLKAQL